MSLSNVEQQLRVSFKSETKVHEVLGLRVHERRWFHSIQFSGPRHDREVAVGVVRRVSRSECRYLFRRRNRRCGSLAGNGGIPLGETGVESRSSTRERTRLEVQASSSESCSDSFGRVRIRRLPKHAGHAAAPRLSESGGLSHEVPSSMAALGGGADR